MSRIVNSTAYHLVKLAACKGKPAFFKSVLNMLADGGGHLSITGKSPLSRTGKLSKKLIMDLFNETKIFFY